MLLVKLVCKIFGTAAELNVRGHVIYGVRSSNLEVYEMSKNAKLRKSIVAVMLAVLMTVSLFTAGVVAVTDVKAATTKTVQVIYTGTEEADLYLDGYQASDYVDTWELVSENSNFTYSKTTDANSYTVHSVSFDFESIYSLDLKLAVGDWNWVGFSWDEINGGQTTKYVYADGTVGTEAPTIEGGDEGGEEGGEGTANEYTVTVNVYGEAATIGAGFANSGAGLWSSYWTQDAALSGDWATTVFTLSDERVFTDFEAQIVVGTEWTSPKYTMSLVDNGATMWIVPEAGTCYDNEADALAAAADPATSSTVIFHYKKTKGTMGGWVVGTWFTSAVNGGWGSKDTVFTYEDDWGYVAVVKYSAVVNEIGFKFHRRAKIDGVKNDWYKEDGSANRTVSLSNGFAEVWITQGKKAVSYTCPSGATKFDASTAKAFKNYRYLLVETAKGEDAELVFHYLRNDGVYDEWAVGIWAEVTSGTWKDAQISQNKELDEYGAATYTVNLAEWPKTEIGFAVNYNNWEKKDYDADRYVDVSGVEAGEILNVYLYEGDGKIYYAPKTDLITEEAGGVDADVVFHYSRTENDYDGWMVGLWCELADGSWLNDNVAFDGTDANGFATVTVDISKFESETLGFKLNKDNWAEEDGGDRSIDLAEIKDGDIIDIYLYEGDDSVYSEPKAVEEEPVEEQPVEEVTVTDVDEPAEETKGGCAGCTGCAVALPLVAVIIAGALVVFKKRA